ncbi:hypothetical protein Val02_02930 [Virgisporangium aliadipatigenens]|uniref:HTH luxR-type domain-containing protein n=1 Tax=Virgisporangium aliadipatigenens TaxID=741659 RepID=A0A8J4DND1_9ACTN|nr:helix-turn-helix transcriptional regulator [Virgisporangium aliadipatigenens]GIJ43407.1 hypothetical protein Val02_02930 [Virgisporangium aliadipatigenens]
MRDNRDPALADVLDRMAANERARGRHATAAAAVELAASLTDDPVLRDERLRYAAADARLAGQRDRARSLLPAGRHSADLGPGLALHLARAELFTGDPATACALAGPVTLAAVAALLSGDPDRAADLLAAARVETIETDVVRAIVLLHGERPSDGAALLRRRVADLARGHTAPEYVILAALGLSQVGAPGAADGLLTPVLDGARAAGIIGVLPLALFASARAALRAGRLRAATALADEGVALADRVTDGFWSQRLHGLLAQVHAVRGDEAACRRHAVRAAGDAANDAIGVLEAGAGRYDEAVVAWRSALPGFTRTAELLEARIRAGRPDTRIPAAVTARTLDGGALPAQAALARRLLGLVAPEGEFARHFEAALVLHRGVDSPFDLGRTLLAYGERLRRAGRRIRARTTLLAAHEIFTTVGARAWVTRAHEELLACGGPGAAGSPADDPSGALTPQELQAARAAAAGATNREVAARLFLSVKTVEFHLSNVYRKLGVRTRTELAHRFPALAERDAAAS